MHVAARASLQLGVEGAFTVASGYLGMLILAWTLGPDGTGVEHWVHT